MNSSARDGGKRGLKLRPLLVALALAAVIVPAVASKLPREVPMVTVPDAGGAYVEAVVGNPGYLNPILLQFNQVDRDLSALLFSGLTRFDENGLIVPDLAERWEIGDGGKSYLFHLRKDVRWHDRTPFTSDDVVFTVKAMQAAGFQGNQEVAELWRDVGVEQVSDYDVRFTLKEPFAPFLEYTTVGILPRHLYSETAGKSMVDSPYNLRPIGTGPFKLTKITGESIALEPHADYYGPAPKLAQLRFRFYPDYPSALAALEKGEVDALPYLDPQDVARLKANDKLAVYSAPDYLRYAVLFLNDSTPPFQDKAVRQAVAYAINKDRMIQAVMEGQAVPGKGAISPGSWAFDSKAKSYEYDPKKAEELLDSAGWRRPDGTGVREKDGQPLAFVILTNDNKRRIKTGELVVDDLRKVGFKAEVQALPWTDLLKEYMGPRTFVGAIAEQWLLTADPDLYSLWHSSQIGGGGFNFSGLNNQRIDQLLEDARHTVDKNKRKELYSEFQQLWADEVPGVILYYPQFSWAVSKNVKDVKLSAMIDGSSRFRHVAQWYVKTKQVPATPGTK
ncbi:MAG: ABC transporter substrate-binding protein [Chloroflexi bacterium]|nr:ABC transporter substrate-binding protein [Chloroflexota bacterium]